MRALILFFVLSQFAFAGGSQVGNGVSRFHPVERIGLRSVKFLHKIRQTAETAYKLQGIEWSLKDIDLAIADSSIELVDSAFVLCNGERKFVCAHVESRKVQVVSSFSMLDYEQAQKEGREEMLHQILEAYLFMSGHEADFQQLFEAIKPLI